MSVSPLLPLAGALSAPTAVRLAGQAVAPFYRVLQSAGQAVGGLVPREPTKGGGASAALSPQAEQLRLETVRRVSFDLLRQWRTRWESLAANQDIDISLPVEFEDDGRGGVVERSGHPQRAQIEALLAESGLGKEFREVARSFLRWADDPSAELSDFRLAIRDGEVSVQA